MLRPDTDQFFTTVLFATANENHGLPGDRGKKKKAAQVWAVANGGTLFSGEELAGDFLASLV